MSAEDIARQALTMFADRGYAETSMEDIAAAAGVSRRTLFRYFDSKAAVIWQGLEPSTRAVVAGLAAAPTDRHWRAAVVDALLASLTFPYGDLELAGQRLRLIAQEPTLRSHLDLTARPVLDALAAFIAARTGAEPGELEPAAASAAVWMAALTGLEWWATQEGGASPGECVRRALHVVGFGEQ